jgi:hypothetical protein
LRAGRAPRYTSEGSVVRTLVSIAAALVVAVGCNSDSPPAERPLRPVLGAAAELLDVALVERVRCESRIRRTLAVPAVPGAPGYDALRAEILVRGKAEPVLFLDTPRFDDERSTEAELTTRQILMAPSPGWGLTRNYRTLAKRPGLLREILLRQGYLYAESPSLAASVVEHVELAHLFDAPAVIIHRGAQRLRALRGDKGIYVYDDGPERGARARVLLFDRLWVEGSEPGPPLHVELRSAQVRAGFDQMRIAHATRSAIVADVRYGARLSRGLFRIEDAQAVLECELHPPGAEEEIGFARGLAHRRQRTLERKRAAILSQIEEALPFDEPRTEIGQQDGNLRPAWIWAYNNGWDSYRFNDDQYMVFDGAGRPKVPQVCIDFITDTLERASGTWWRRRDEQRERLAGKLDFELLALDNRRSVERFVRFAKAHPEWFDVHDLSPEDRIPFFQRERFYAHLRERSDTYQPGDIVVIHGLRDDGEFHYHSFWIYDADPVTGMPTLVASNAGRPRIRTWEFEMRNAPRRSIRHRIRPRLQWLEQVVSLPGETSSKEPAPLASAPI